MARSAYTLDGVNLVHPQLKYFPERKSGVRVIPAKSSPNIEYPSYDGEAYLPGATYDPGAVGIKMYVKGTTHEEFMTNFEFINGLFMQRHKLLTLRHDYNEAGTNARFAEVQFLSGSEPEWVGPGANAALIDYVATIPGVFWRSQNTIDNVTPAITTAVVERELSALSGGNAPIYDSLIRVKGAFSSLTIVESATGHTITVNTSLTATEYIIIDTANWTARKVTTDTWTGGTVVDHLVTSSRGQGSMISLEPMISGGALKYFLKLSATAPSGSPNLTVRARKSYL